MTDFTKTTKVEARKSLAITGELLTAVLNGGVIIDHQFNGWNWSVLVKLAEKTNDGFAYGQFENTENGEFHLMVQRNGSTKKQVWKAFMEDYNETRRLKNIAFDLGNIK